MRGLLASIGTWLALATSAIAAETIVAVAANFAQPAGEIAAAFTEATGDTVVLSFGSTGALRAQIAQGAPFAVLLAADDRRPALAVEAGDGVAGTVFTYAVGKPVLYSASIDVSDGEAVLRGGDFAHLAIAEPGAAPYGAAAVEVLAALGLAEVLTPKVVTGENISQTLQFIDSGNAELGFVALSQVIGKPDAQVWVVPPELHTPIRQDAVLLRAGEDDAVAKAFLEFLRGATAHAIIESYGYDIAD